jgi:putative transposase
MVAAAVRTIFAQPDAAAVTDQLDSIAAKLGHQFPAVEAMLRDAAVDPLRLRRLPPGPPAQDLEHESLGAGEPRDHTAHQRRGHFPNEAGVLRLAGSVLLEVPDEWLVTDRRLPFRSFDGEARPDRQH